VVLERLPSMLTRHPRLQVAVHGRGEHALEQGLAALVNEFPGRLSVTIGYREDLEHRMHAGADVLLHGSRFEPCGLAQLYAMHYGTIPIVRHVGGLADSVIDAGEPPHRTIGSTGFVFEQANGEAMESALDRCLEIYRDWPQTWSDMRKLAMSADFGWSRSAREYAELYADLMPGRAMDRKKVHARESRALKASSWTGQNVAARQQALARL
jgi:starch synthase